MQRNNIQNTKMIVSVLLTIIILSGCSNAEVVAEPKETEIIIESVETAVVEDTEVHDINKDSYYYINFYKITNKEIENRLKRIDIKYPDSVHRGHYVKALIVKDNDIYKVIPAIELWDLEHKVAIFYDLFTEEKLFEYPYKSTSEITAEFNEYGNYTGGYDFKKIKNAIPYFDGKEIKEFGACFYPQTFLQNYINEISKKDGINYALDVYRILDYNYDLPFNSDSIMLKTYDYAKNYVTTVPLENQVTSEELGLKSTYRIEDKYFDYWKISNEEIDESLVNFEIAGEDMKMSADTIQSLVLKDSEGNFKLMNVIMIDKGKDGLEFVDLYSEMHLFNARVKGTLDYDKKNEKYTGLDLKNISDAIPYFEDKEIVKVDNFFGCVYFVENNYEYLVEKDNVNYNPLENSYYFYLYPDNDSDSFYLNEIVKTKEEFAKYYIISIPEDLQIATKDLNFEKRQIH